MPSPHSRSRVALVAALVAAVLAVGCGGGTENKTNPDLKVPDVPAGRGQEKGGVAPKEVKKVKKS